MIVGIGKVVLEVEDQERARVFWTEAMGFEVVRDAPYGEGRWLEVGTADRSVVLALAVRHGELPSAPDALPTSNVFFSCDDLERTHRELSERGVEFPQPPVRLGFGWWSLFADGEGNRFALVPRGQ